MANQEHLDILAKGVGAWNEWRMKRFPGRTDISGANLNSGNLARANFLGTHASKAAFRGADLDGADFSGADFSEAVFDDAAMHKAIFDGVSLRRASFVSADLSNAMLYQANLYDANFTEANFRFAALTRSEVTGASFDGASFFETVLSDMDLRPAMRLESVKHEGPSTIGIDTIFRSGGQIPEPFLLGCGVPDSFIAYARSLTSTAFDFYSCFISYSSKDQPFADRLHADLQARGVRCWFAPHDIHGGRKIREQIDEAIKLYDKLLLILSDASMNSNWVKTEIANARAKETQQGRQVLFPITLVPFAQIKGWKLFDADTGTDTAREIREYFLPDFSNWKDHDSYTKAFERLVRDLKAGPDDQAKAQPAPE
jgi:uncharacterized protein YjbI with pentapeptide repeats